MQLFDLTEMVTAVQLLQQAVAQQPLCAMVGKRCCCGYVVCILVKLLSQQCCILGVCVCSIHTPSKAAGSGSYFRGSWGWSCGAGHHPDTSVLLCHAAM